MINRIKLLKITTCFFLLAFVFGCSSPLKPKLIFKSKGKTKGVYHKVKKGETLWRIAKTYNINHKKLKRVNHINDASKVKAGTKLFIPGAKKVLKVKKVSLNRKVPSIKRKGFFNWPLKGTLTSRYGIRKNQKHDGIDIAAQKGSAIYAADSGKVIFSGWGPTGYGKIVIIKHKQKWVTVYAHNSKNLVKKNHRVKKGEKIALVGTTGRATGPHLHFELRDNREPVNPLNFLK
ncbi:MAG: peptidoglycan DD-metalloendopeptidase family protein [Nitrospinota bacterium]